MIQIRPAQLRVLHQRLISTEVLDALVEHLRTCFPACVHGLDAEALHERIQQCARIASDLGLSREADLLRFVGLAATYGWSFVDDPAHAWMRAILEDPRHGKPARRLDHLVRACLRQLEIELHNERLTEIR